MSQTIEQQTARPLTVLAEDEEMFRASVREFAEGELRPRVEEMGEQGKYIVYVGSLTVPLHNKWADFAIAYQKAHYPKMQLAADRFGVAESVDDSYKTALDDFQNANQNDVFIQCLIGMTYEKMGQKDKAMEYYRKAATATSHNPPGGFARRFTREKLG